MGRFSSQSGEQLPPPFGSHEEGQRRRAEEEEELPVEEPIPPLSCSDRLAARRIGDDDREPNLGGPPMGPAGGMLVGPDHPIFSSDPPPRRGGSGHGQRLPPDIPSSSFLPPYCVNGPSCPLFSPLLANLI